MSNIKTTLVSDDLIIVDHVSTLGQFSLGLLKKDILYQELDFKQSYIMNVGLDSLIIALMNNYNLFKNFAKLISTLGKDEERTQQFLMRLFPCCRSSRIFIEWIATIFWKSYTDVICSISPLLMNTGVAIDRFYPIAYIQDTVVLDPRSNKEFAPHYWIEVLPSQKGNGYMNILRDYMQKNYWTHRELYCCNVLNMDFLCKKWYQMSDADKNLFNKKVSNIKNTQLTNLYFEEIDTLLDMWSVYKLTSMF